MIARKTKFTESIWNFKHKKELIYYVKLKKQNSFLQENAANLLQWSSQQSSAPSDRDAGTTISFVELSIRKFLTPLFLHLPPVNTWLQTEFWAPFLVLSIYFFCNFHHCADEGALEALEQQVALIHIFFFICALINVFPFFNLAPNSVLQLAMDPITKESPKML